MNVVNDGELNGARAHPGNLNCAKLHCEAKYVLRSVGMEATQLLSCIRAKIKQAKVNSDT
eukprot:6203942-Pleurochrysis_carterae.AAC.2